jgi:hypothetical protein
MKKMKIPTPFNDLFYPFLLSEKGEEMNNIEKLGSEVKFYYIGADYVTETKTIRKIGDKYMVFVRLFIRKPTGEVFCEPLFSYAKKRAIGKFKN